MLKWGVVHQLRRPYKSLNPNWCILCMRGGELIDHLFLHCPITLRLWHKLFNIVWMDQVPPKSICDMMTISFRGFRCSMKGKAIWQIACLTLPWIVQQERNARIFEEKWKTVETLWDLLHFYSSLWASCTTTFKGTPLNIIQLNSCLACNQILYSFPCIVEEFMSHFDQIRVFCGEDP